MILTLFLASYSPQRSLATCKSLDIGFHHFWLILDIYLQSLSFPNSLKFICDVIFFSPIDLSKKIFFLSQFPSPLYNFLGFSPFVRSGSVRSVFPCPLLLPPINRKISLPFLAQPLSQTPPAPTLPSPSIAPGGLGWYNCPYPKRMVEKKSNENPSSCLQKQQLSSSV